MTTKITNHQQLATDYVITYLKEIDNLSSLTELSGDRYQIIEDCIWYILSNLDIDSAVGYWLDLLGEKAGRSREAYSVPANLFTFDNTNANENGFGQVVGDGLGGLLLEGVNVFGNTQSSLQDELYRLVIKFAIILNNYNASRSTIINAIKILTNSSKVLLKDAGVLEAEVTIENTISAEYKDFIKDLITEIMPQCVYLKNVYLEDLNTPFLLDSEEQGLDNGIMDYAI